MNYTKTTLSTGIRLILIPNKSTEVVTLMAMVGVGSRDESKKIAGISHLLEHLHYMGTEKRPTPVEIAEYIESFGGEHNAFTGKEYTGYYAKVTPKHLEGALDFISDNLLHSKMTDSDVAHEKAVINQEINMYEDIPHEVCSNKFEEVIFGDNALGRDIIGFRETLDATTREDILNYKQNHYFADNLVVVISGNTGKYSDDELKELIEKYFPLPQKGALERTSVELSGEKNLEIIVKDTAQAQIAVGFKTVPQGHEDAFTLDLMSVLLGGAMSSRMFQEIREKRQLAYSVRTHTSNYRESGLLVTQAGVNEGKTLEAIKAIINEYKKLKETPVPNVELARAKEIINGKMLIKFENSEELAYHYATDETVLGRIYTPKELAEIFNKITSDDILKVANKYFTDQGMGLCFVGKALDKTEVEKIFKI